MVFLINSDVALIPGLAHAEVVPNPAQINMLALIRVPEPAEIVVMGKGSLALAFGAIGALAVGADAMNQKGLLGAISRTKFSFADQLTQDLSAALAERGLKTQVVSADRKGRPDKSWLCNGAFPLLATLATRGACAGCTRLARFLATLI